MEREPIRLDGGEGEGGGQVLRIALSLSLITGRSFELKGIRARRPEPGLRPQHVACLRACEILGGKAEGATVGSPEVRFEPAALKPGSYELDAGPTGSIPLLLQTVGFPLALAREPSSLKLRGATHTGRGPAFHYLNLLWRPVVRALGFAFDLDLASAGYLPEGGGEVRATIQPAGIPEPWELRSRGMLQEVRVLSVVSNLPFRVAEQQSQRAVQKLRDKGIYAQAESVPVPAARSKGAMVLILGQFERCSSAAAALGDRTKSAERVAEEAADSFCRYMSRRGAVDEYLADQLLLPLAIGASGLQCGRVRPPARFTTTSLSGHLFTNAAVISRFLDVEIKISGQGGEEGEVRVAPMGLRELAGAS